MPQLGQLPGVTFQIKPPPPAETLPRMDIAAFVGFAASGPLHIPVAVEDVARFREIFGPDLPLARAPHTEPETAVSGLPDVRSGAGLSLYGAGQMQYAHLGPAVESFFRNGGRRCWVVRVAANTAVTNRFLLPGLVAVNTWQPAVARARSAGSWSDLLRVGTLRQGEAFGLAKQSGTASPDLSLTTGDYRLGLKAKPGQLGPGDLLQLSFEADGPLCFLVVETVSPNAGRQIITARQAHWFLRYNPASLPPAATTATLLTGQPEPALSILQVSLASDATESYRVEFEQRVGQQPVPGDLLRLDFSSGETLLLSLADVVEGSSGGSLPEKSWIARATDGFWPVTETEGLSQAAGLTPAVERLTFELLVWQGQELQARLSRLAFASFQARSWTALPTDEALFRLVEGQPAAPEAGSLAAEAAEPRFPLAGPETAAALYLPLGMLTAPSPETAQPAGGDASPETHLARNGLRQFSADLFLDPDLARVGLGALLTEANYKYYLRGDRGEPLLGLHSLLPLDEVTLLAAPDAVQPGWVQVQPPKPEVLLPPTLALIQTGDESGRYLLRWSAVAGAESYTLQAAGDVAFGQAVTRYSGAGLQEAILPEDNCPQLFAYRVRARRGSMVSPWSNTVSLVTPLPDFEGCDLPKLDPLTLTLDSVGSPPTEEMELSWTPEPEALRYRLETAEDPAFLTAKPVVSDLTTTVTLAEPRHGIHFYRVRAERDDLVGPWSNTEIFVATPPQVWEMVHPKHYSDGDLLAIQRGLIRFCAARGDLLALLALPAHYRQEETAAHVGALRPHAGQAFGAQTGSGSLRVAPLTFGEAPALSFSALFHPWLALPRSSTGGETRFMPPDGAVCGQTAAKALAEGAWIAPANDPFRGVVALNPALDRPGWQRLYQDQVNLVRQDPRGFLLLSANTLSLTSELELINVRRLLILLRRLALREGAQFTFASNSETFRNIVQFKFERLLAQLYHRGAFAGNEPAAAYQVVTDSSVNTPASIDQGRFIIELRIAPSHPLAFITVRLVHLRNEGLLVQES